MNKYHIKKCFLHKLLDKFNFTHQNYKSNFFLIRLEVYFFILFSDKIWEVEYSDCFSSQDVAVSSTLKRLLSFLKQIVRVSQAYANI